MSLFGKVIFVLLAARLIVFFVQSLPAFQQDKKLEFFAKLFRCDLCLGFYVNFILCAFYKVEITSNFAGYIPLVSEVITAMFFSFITHLVILGAKTRWGIFEV